MNAYILFIDTDHAKFFSLTPSKVEIKNLKKHEVKHHTPQDHKNVEHEHHFFEQVVSELSAATEVLVVGPGQAKTRFKGFLDTHHHKDLSNKIVGVETVDHPSEAKIIELGRKFFKNYDMFNA